MIDDQTWLLIGRILIVCGATALFLAVACAEEIDQ